MATKKTSPKAAAVKKTVEPLEAAVAAGKEAADTATKAATQAAVETKVETKPAPAAKAAAPVKKPAPKAVKPAFPFADFKAPGFPFANFKAPGFPFAEFKAPGFPFAEFKAPAFEGYEEFAAAGKENVEAFVKSGNLLAKGMEALSKEVMAFTQASIEGNVEATKAVMGAKSFKEAVDLQTDYAKKNVDQMLAEGARLAELSVKVTNQAMEPIQARVDVTMKTIMKPIAA